MPQYLVDVSNWNAPDWPAFKQKLGGVYNKATEGLSYRDPTYPHNRINAHNYGIPFGAYAFHHPSFSGQAQAQRFLGYAQPKPGDLRPVIDTETTDGFGYVAIGRSVLGMALEVRAGGFEPILYASKSWIERLVSAVPELKGFDWWQAEYNSVLHRIPGLRYLLWQFTDKMIVGKGRFDGDLLLVRQLPLIPSPTPKPPPPKPKHNLFQWWNPFGGKWWGA